MNQALELNLSTVSLYFDLVKFAKLTHSDLPYDLLDNFLEQNINNPQKTTKNYQCKNKSEYQD